MNTIRAGRRAITGRAASGITSAQDQDLLRAMLVFACAGLDASMKTLIRDALPTLAEHHPDVQDGLTDFGRRLLSDSGGVSGKMLAAVLTHPTEPRTAIIEAYIQDLTGSSLQSADELQKVCSVFGIDDRDFRNRVKNLRPAFVARNEIIHELDLTPDGRLNRRTRAIWEMAEWASSVLEIGQEIVDEVSVSLVAGESTGS